MIRVRNSKGTVVQELDENHFIELCNPEGEIISVFYENKDNGAIHELQADAEADAARYSKMFDVSFVEQQIILNN